MLYNSQKVLFVNPSELGHVVDKYCSNFDANLKRQEKQRIIEQEKVNILRVKSVEDFANALAKTKEQDRRPLIVSSLE